MGRLRMQYVIEPCTSLDEAAEKMAALANEKAVTVVGDFNSIRLVCLPGGTANGIIQLWERKKSDRRRLAQQLRFGAFLFCLLVWLSILAVLLTIPTGLDPRIILALIAGGVGWVFLAADALKSWSAGRG